MAVDYGLHMTIPTWHAAEPARLDEVPAMVAAGCATFKAYQAYPGMMLDDVALLRAMQAVAAAGGSLVLHSETGPVLDVLRAGSGRGRDRRHLARTDACPGWRRPPSPAALGGDRRLSAAHLPRGQRGRGRRHRRGPGPRH
ncbi:MAG: hypothetical protein R2851_09950 [Caldilineaceae bacterium]